MNTQTANEINLKKFHLFIFFAYINMKTYNLTKLMNRQCQIANGAIRKKKQS